MMQIRIRETTFHFDADPDPDPDPASQKYVDPVPNPDPQHWLNIVPTDTYPFLAVKPIDFKTSIIHICRIADQFT